MFGGLVLPSSDVETDAGEDSDPSDDPKSDGGGFLKRRGYSPEPSDEPELTETLKPSHGLDRLGHISTTSQKPRPEPISKPKDTKAQARKVAQISKRDQYSKYPELKRAKKIRYGLVAVAIVILLFSTIFSFQNYLSMTTNEASLPEQGYEFMHDLHNYEELLSDHDSSIQGWDAAQFLLVTSEQIESDLGVKFNFIIEVYDHSTFEIHYDRTLQNGLAWSNLENIRPNFEANKETFEISSFMNLIISPEEIHLIRIDITIWD
jgi:hypothetical protein